MTWETLAPWIAIAFTLALSILVPLFTQIANNRHQRKMQREKMDYEQREKKIKAYEFFLSAVGGIIAADGNISSDNLQKAGSAIHQLYIYSPSEWYCKLDLLTEFVMNYKWKESKDIVQELSRLISEEIKNNHI